jgi:hypothetical protein
VCSVGVGSDMCVMFPRLLTSFLTLERVRSGSRVTWCPRQMAKRNGKIMSLGG